MEQFEQPAKIAEIHFQLRLCRYESECDFELCLVLLPEIHRYFLFLFKCFSPTFISAHQVYIEMLI